MLAPLIGVNGYTSLLPTPVRGDGEGGRTKTYGKASGTLPGAISLLPTPRASDGEKGGPNQRGSSGDPMLPNVVYRLTGASTPRQSDVGKPSSESPHPARTPEDPVEV